MNLFKNRRDAGVRLGHFLKNFDFEEPVLLALPRGGVVVGDEVAKILNLSLNVVIARKIGAPGQPEYGIGAVSEDEIPRFNPAIKSYLDTNDPIIQSTVIEEIEEMHRRVLLYRDGHNLSNLRNKTVIIVDDGLATGVTALAAAKYIRSLGPKSIILAVPLGPQDIGANLSESYDEIICLNALPNLRGVGLWYQDFDQTEDSEVLTILKSYQKEELEVESNTKRDIENFEDKYKKSAGRKAFQDNKESEFLNDESLEMDLVEEDAGSTDHGRIVSSENPENQEWNAREQENRDQ